MKVHVVVEAQEEGGFTVWCLEVPGAISQGETEAEALSNIEDAIRMIVEDRIAEGLREAKSRHAHVETLELAYA